MKIKKGTLVIVKRRYLGRKDRRLTVIVKKLRDGTFFLKGYGNCIIEPEVFTSLIQTRKKEERQNLQIALKNHHRAIIKKLLTMVD